MGRRGSELREHILWVAKDVFLELGFERASMDEVATRAATSKRTLYARFENKEKLFLAVIELVRSLFLSRLKEPGDYSTQPEEAMVLFCARYLEGVLYAASVRMCRLSMAESERFPEQAGQYFDVLFTQVHARLSTYMRTVMRMSAYASDEAAQDLLGRVLYPGLLRALFGIDPLEKELASQELPPTIDLKPIRKVVREVMSNSAS